MSLGLSAFMGGFSQMDKLLEKGKGKGILSTPKGTTGETAGATYEAEPPAVSNASPSPPTTGGSAPSQMGSLSAKYESEGSSGAISHDRTGGWSYGRFQFVGGGTTADGSSMRGFLSTLSQRDPEAFATLEKAGGMSAATSGSDAFKGAWKQVSSRPGFQEAENETAAKTLYGPAEASVSKATGIAFGDRSPALREVLFSTAMQHGPAGSQALWRNALGGADAGKMTDAEIINRLYDERSKVGSYFRSSTPEVQQAVASRFQRERADALGMLGTSKEPKQMPAYTSKPDDNNSSEAPGWGVLRKLTGA